jgi:hypothetical protein
VSALLGRIGYCQAAVADTSAARAILSEMEGLLSKGDVANVHLADVCAGLGERTMEYLVRLGLQSPAR